MTNDQLLIARLKTREEQGLLRNLPTQNSLIDFSSNDYLGFARSEELRKMIQDEISDFQFSMSNFNGSTGSRLLTGNSQYAEELEEFISEYHRAEAGLIFNSGYAANTGLLPAVARKEDMIFYDELVHASIHDGIRLAKSKSYPFLHNNLNHLEERLKFFQSISNKNSSCFVIVESVYSMDGDFSPLKEIVSLCEIYDASLIVDEAHVTGIFGAKGEGRVVELNLQRNIFARIHTFSKALGCHGAIILGSHVLKSYLVNFARSFIYTTALPVHSLAAIKSTYKLLKESSDKMLITNNLINLFVNRVQQENFTEFLKSLSAIQGVILPGNETVKRVAQQVQIDGFDVRPILSPSVPKEKERIRICLHAFNTEDEINGLFVSLKKNIIPKVVKNQKMITSALRDSSFGEPILF